MEPKTLTTFRHLSKLDHPEWQIDDFCQLIFTDIEEDPSLEAHVKEIRHYKEEDGVEHEFLIAFVVHARKQYVLRLERSRSPQKQPSFFKMLLQLGASTPAALDTIRVSLSEQKLTAGMGHGASILVSRLSFPPRQLPLNELCLMLSFFLSFSPKYKLAHEQSYWFCDVVVTAAREGCKEAQFVEEVGFNKAGRLGKLAIVRHSSHRRRSFVDAYYVVRGMGGNSEQDPVPSMLLRKDAVDTLVSMLSVPSTEARFRAVVTLTRVAKHSPDHRRMVAEARAVGRLARIIPTSAPELQAHILTALEAITGESWPLEPVSESNRAWDTHNLSPALGTTDSTVRRGVADALATLATSSRRGANSALTALVSGLSKEAPHSQLVAFQALSSSLRTAPPLVTPQLVVPMSKLLSSSTHNPNVRREVAETLVTVINQIGLSENTLCRANIHGMLVSESDDLKEVVLRAISVKLPSSTLESALVTGSCIPAIEQLIFADRTSSDALEVFHALLQHIDVAYPYDSRLLEILIKFVKGNDLQERVWASAIIAKLVPLPSVNSIDDRPGSPSNDPFREERLAAQRAVLESRQESLRELLREARPLAQATGADSPSHGPSDRGPRSRESTASEMGPPLDRDHERRKKDDWSVLHADHIVINSETLDTATGDSDIVIPATSSQVDQRILVPEPFAESSQGTIEPELAVSKVGMETSPLLENMIAASNPRETGSEVINAADSGISHVGASEKIVNLVRELFASDGSDISELAGLQELKAIKWEVKGEKQAGGFGDVYRGMLSDTGQEVAVKEVRIYARCSPEKLTKIKRRLWREIAVMHGLNHPNVVKLLGISLESGPLPIMISPWYPNGNAVQFLEQNPGADRLRIIRGVVSGLKYMHDCQPVVIHGDLKPDNVLVSDDGDGVLCDFGVSKVLDTATGFTTTAVVGSQCFMAKELLIYEGERPVWTTATDVYAFGGTCLQLIADSSLAFKGQHVVLAIVQGHKPLRPENFRHDSLWALLLRCWEAQPDDRPSISEIEDQLSAMTLSTSCND